MLKRTAFILLAGCTAMTNAPRPEGLIPIDILVAQTEVLGPNPQTDAVAVLDANGRGLILGLDGTATYLDPSALISRVETTVSGFTDNTMCLAEAGTWGGICVDLYKQTDGQYYCDGNLGDGGVWANTCTIKPTTRTP